MIESKVHVPMKIYVYHLIHELPSSNSSDDRKSFEIPNNSDVQKVLSKRSYPLKSPPCSSHESWTSLETTFIRCNWPVFSYNWNHSNCEILLATVPKLKENWSEDIEVLMIAWSVSSLRLGSNLKRVKSIIINYRLNSS